MGTARPHGKWSDPNIPHKGWSCIEFDDRGAPDEACEMCEHQSIRYVHSMRHPEYPHILRVGCECAGKMEEDYAAAAWREKQGKNYARRKANWLTRTWRISAQGNEYIRVESFHIVVYPGSSGLWKARITDTQTENSLVSKRRYYTAEQVKIAAFDAMLMLKEKWRG